MVARQLSRRSAFKEGSVRCAVSAGGAVPSRNCGVRSMSGHETTNFPRDGVVDRAGGMYLFSFGGDHMYPSSLCSEVWSKDLPAP